MPHEQVPAQRQDRQDAEAQNGGGGEQRQVSIAGIANDILEVRVREEQAYAGRSQRRCHKRLEYAPGDSRARRACPGLPLRAHQKG